MQGKSMLRAMGGILASVVLCGVANGRLPENLASKAEVRANSDGEYSPDYAARWAVLLFCRRIQTEPIPALRRSPFLAVRCLRTGKQRLLVGAFGKGVWRYGEVWPTDLPVEAGS